MRSLKKTFQCIRRCWEHIQLMCEESGFLDFYSASGSKVLTPAPRMTPDLRKLLDSYS